MCGRVHACGLQPFTSCKSCSEGCASRRGGAGRGGVPLFAKSSQPSRRLARSVRCGAGGRETGGAREGCGAAVICAGRGGLTSGNGNALHLMYVICDEAAGSVLYSIPSTPNVQTFHHVPAHFVDVTIGQISGPSPPIRGTNAKPRYATLRHTMPRHAVPVFLSHALLRICMHM